MKRKLVTYFPIAVLAVGLTLGMAAALMALRPSSGVPTVDAAHVAYTTSPFVVTPSPRTAGELAEYVFTFGVTGLLTSQLMPANVAEFRVTFDKDMTIPASIPANSVLVQASLLTNAAELTGDCIGTDPGADDLNHSSAGANQAIPLVQAPSFDVDVADPNRKVVVIKVPDMNPATGTGSCGAGAQGIAAGAKVTITFTTAAGLRNEPERTGSSEFNIRACATVCPPATASPNLVDGTHADNNDVFNPYPIAGVFETTAINAKVTLNAVDGARGTTLTAVAKGLKDGTTATFWLEIDGVGIAGTRDVGESDLANVVVGSDDTATATFTVNNPPFKPGKVNSIAVQDGRLNKAPTTDLPRFELRGVVQATPAIARLGDTLTIQLKDFDNGCNMSGGNVGTGKTLAADITAVATTGIIITGHGYTAPADVNRRLRFDNEFLRITGVTDVNTLTVARGAGGTTAALHTAGTAGNQVNACGTYDDDPASTNLLDAFPLVRLGGVLFDPTKFTGTTITAQNEANFTAIVPNGVPLGTQALEVVFACCRGGGAEGINGFQSTRRQNLTVGGAVLVLTPETIVPNQTLNITGNDYTDGGGITINESAGSVGNCLASLSSMTIQGVAIPRAQINEGNTISVAGGGNWSASIIIPVNTTTTTPGTYDLKVTDCRGREGVGKLTIPPRVLNLTPKEGQVGTPVTINGTGFPAKNDRTGGVTTTVTIKYDAGSSGGTTTISVQPDASGNINGTLNVPTNANIPSTNTLNTEFDGDGSPNVTSLVVNTVTHEVPKASLTINPATGRPGTKVTATVKGAKAFSTITSAEIGAKLDVKPAPVPFTDGIGNLTFDFVVPQMEVGVQNFEVKIGTTTASAPFTVEGGATVPPPGNVPPTTPIGTALTTPLGVDFVRAFNFNNQTKVWTFNDPRPEFATINTLKDVNAGQVYWINVANDKTITFCGRSVTFYKGWNQSPC